MSRQTEAPSKHLCFLCLLPCQNSRKLNVEIKQQSIGFHFLSFKDSPPSSHASNFTSSVLILSLKSSGSGAKKTKQHDTLAVDNQSKPLNINSKEDCVLLLCALYRKLSADTLFSNCHVFIHFPKKSGRKKADYQNRRPL